MRQTVWIILSIAILPTLTGCSTCPDRTGRVIDEVLFKDLPADTIVNEPGWIVAVLKKGRLVYQRSFGMADVESNIPITPQTAFELSSLSQYFTGATIALLIENGAISLNDDIRTFIPEMPRRDKPITLEHLIYHTSGIPDYVDVMKKAGIEKADDPLQIVDLLAKAELQFEPGEKSNYRPHEFSRSNYFLLAFIVQRITGVSMGEWTEKVLFGPLDMDKALFADHPDKQVDNRARGYKRTFYNGIKSEFVEVENPNMGIVGDRGLYMSMDQLLIWEKAFYNKKIGGETFRELMQRTGATLENKRTVNYAFGLKKAYDDAHQPVWGQYGASPGFGVSYERYTAKDFTVIVLCNVENMELKDLGGFVGAFYYKDIRQAPDPLKPPGWDYLFNGKTFKGWEGDRKMFRIKDGAIVGGTLKEPIPRNEFLCTKKEYGDFILRLKVKLLGDVSSANAGIQIRSRRIPNHHEMIGYQADMGQHYWGCLYDESRRRKVLARPDRTDMDKVLKPGEWNDYMIKCEGKRIQLFINGYQTVDYTEDDDSIEQTGVIGLQIHGGKASEARYKDILIKEL